MPSGVYSRVLKTHCKHGHEFTEANTYRRKDRPHERICWACKREKWKWSRRPLATRQRHNEREKLLRLLRAKQRPKLSPEELFAIRSKRAIERYDRKGRIPKEQIRLRQALAQQKSRRHNPEYRRKNVENYKHRNYDKYLAGRILRAAVQRGHISKPKHCTNCGLVCNPEGHHRDYSKPLEVMWLCRGCHCREHGRELRIKAW
jgi:hypothetical protein